MKVTTIVGLVLVVIGTVMLLTGGFSYKKNEEVLDAGPLHATVEHTKHVSVSPIVGGIVLVAGVALLFAGGRRKM